MSGCVAVFDVGKTNIKVVVFDRGGAVLAERSAPNTPLAPDAEWPYLRLDTEGAWSFLIGALKELGARFSIEAISTTTHGCAGVLMRSDGPALPPLDYEFDGFAAVDADYDAARPPFDEARSPHLSRGLNLGRHIFYFERHYPAQFKQATAFLTYAQYFAWRLGGAMASEVTSLGAHTDLWRPNEGDLSSMVDKLGWRRLFPPMRKAWDTLGTLKPEVAACDWLVRRCAHHLRRARFERLSRAASPVQARAVHRDLDRNLGHHHGRRRNGAARSQSRHAGQCRRARRAGADGALHGRPRISRSLPATRRPTRTKPTSPPSSLLARSPCPHSPIRAARSPRAKASSRAPAPTTPKARAALATLYSALMTAHMLRRLEAPGDLIVEGGFARSPAFAAVLARLMAGRRVVIAPMSAGAAAGAAMLAHWGEPHPPPRLEPARVWDLPGLEAYRDRWERAL